MAKYTITIEGDSPDSLHENVQAWLDSREDGAGTLCEGVRSDSSHDVCNTDEWVQVGDVVRRIKDGVKFRIDERVHPYVFSGVGSNGWREYGCKDGEYVIVERSERPNVGDMIIDYAGREAIVEEVADDGVIATQTRSRWGSFSPNGTYTIIRRQDDAVHYTPIDKAGESKPAFTNPEIKDGVLKASLEISGCISTNMNQDEWTDAFIAWIESRGEAFGGSIVDAACSERLNDTSSTSRCVEVADAGDLILDYAGRKAIVENVMVDGVSAKHIEGKSGSVSPHGQYTIIRRVNQVDHKMDTTSNLSTEELVSILSKRDNVSTMISPLCDEKANISYFDTTTNDRMMFSAYGPCTILVIQDVDKQ